MIFLTVKRNTNGGDHIPMKTKNKAKTRAIIVLVLAIFFFASQDVQESIPEPNFLHDQLLQVVDSLQKELAGYKKREIIFLRRIAHEEYVATAYLSVDPKEGRHSGLTATGVMAKPHFTVAVDPEVVPINSWIWIDDLGWWKAQDTGNAIRGKKIDLCLSTREEALEFGVRKIRIRILR
jgi:3D (Asp-Asp-Asp) domain-containing protein